ncbi:glycoside hydrolase family 2 protein [Sinomicrobium sp. FJxs]|uniref:Glycoside hydrolase family 2 protein n=2 Tax=Sinomicrobium weinanense TaxID=2842200 RepID=A0A926JSD9_9FLAO|nr:beta-galactosidase GalB [Sinomicrobium weinanense]MBC9796392.1 glycoside hydrolase family 2 protein [Sinomicrobium weinanense]MBU3122607.1 DUF4982 domain-containing protein [Sinomicrobium weinanense]
MSCMNTGKSKSIPVRKQPFNRDWQFCSGDTAGVSWHKLNLPHDWSIEGEFNKDHPATFSGGALPGGIGYYKKEFNVPSGYAGKQVYIEFDGVYMNSEVYLNGKLLGRRPNGYIGFEYNLTPYLNVGAGNTLTVKVDNSQQPNSRWYSGSGIYRNVWLTVTGKVHVKHWGTYVTTPKVSKDQSDVHAEVEVINNRAEDRKGVVRTIVLFKGEKVSEKEQTVTLKAGNTHLVTDDHTVKNPQLWSVETPALYTLETEIYVDDRLVDRHRTPFGIRSFDFDTDKGFILNGRQLKIRGVCNHHDLGALGTAVNTRALERQLEILRGMGVNAIRTAHNPPAPELLELCDKMGFLVMDEVFDMWEKGKSRYDYSLYWDEWHRQDLIDFIKRDRNHPSVFIWSIGNEIPEQWEERGAETGRELSKIVRRLDDTRPVTAGMNPPIHTNNKDVTLQFDEPATPNALAGSGALDLIGYNYAHRTYLQHQINFPETPFIATETTSALATRGYYDQRSDTVKRWPYRWDQLFLDGNPDNTVSAYDQVSAPWGSTHEETWKIIKKHDFLSGMFIWTGFDYLGEPTPYVWPSRSSYFGVIDLAGFPKDAYYMYKSEWTDETVLHIFPHWNWEPGREVDIWAYYNNADEVELYLNGRSLGKRSKKGDDLHVMWRVPFNPGTLKAVSRKDGRDVLVKEIKTAGTAAQIQLEADRNTISADSKDLSFVTVSIADTTGNFVPTATNRIEFEISGPGKIVGVDNGDPTSHESFKAKNRKAFYGKCLVIVQSAGTAGEIQLTAKSKGLKPQKLVINTTRNRNEKD